MQLEKKKTRGWYPIRERSDRNLTNEVLSLPVVGSTIDGDVEAYVALVLEERLHADRAIPVDHRAYHDFVLEAALDLLALVEARPCDVDNSAAQHVTALRGENQWQMSTSCVSSRVSIVIRSYLSSSSKILLTDILVASAQHYLLVDPEDVSTREAVRPASARQVAYRGRLGVRLVLVALSTVSGIESHLR